MTTNLIRHYGRPKTATLPDGREVSASTVLMFPDPATSVPIPVQVEQYDEHFIFRWPDPVPHNHSVYMCTCGSRAVVPLDRREMKLVCELFEMSRRSQVGQAMHANTQARWI